MLRIFPEHGLRSPAGERQQQEEEEGPDDAAPRRTTAAEGSSSQGVRVEPGGAVVVGPGGASSGLPSYQQRLQALRKEKSRDAARSRRGKENLEFYELGKMLPLPGAITGQLDKASLVRLTISHLRMRDFAAHGDPPWEPSRECSHPGTTAKGMGNQCGQIPKELATEVFEEHLGSQILQSLDGFVFTLNFDGRFLYISETVSIYLGLSQVEMAGSSAFEYVHPADRGELAEQLGMKLPSGPGTPSQSALGAAEDAASTASSSSQADGLDPELSSPPLINVSEGLDRSFFIRMKSTLTKRGLHVKSSGYKVIHVVGRLRVRAASSSAGGTSLGPAGVDGGGGGGASVQLLGLVALAHALPPPTLSEIRIDCHMFVTRVSLDLRILYCENRVSDYLDFAAEELVGKSCYHFIHPGDVEGIRLSHLDLLNKGQCVTRYVRWLQKGGGYVWVQSSATVNINTKNANEKTVIWISYILSNTEDKDLLMDLQQLPHHARQPSESAEPSESDSDSKDNSDEHESMHPHKRQRRQREEDEEWTSPLCRSRCLVDPIMTQGESSGASSQGEDNEEDDDDEKNGRTLDGSDHEVENGHADGYALGLSSSSIKVEQLSMKFSAGGPTKGLHDKMCSGRLNGNDRSHPEQSSAKPLKQRKPKRRKSKRLLQQMQCSPAESVAYASSPSLSSPHGQIKTEKPEHVHFIDGSVWDSPLNRDMARNDLPYCIVSPSPDAQQHFLSAQTSLHVAIPDSVLTPPGPDSATSQRSAFVASPQPGAASVTLAGSDPLSPPLSASPREGKPGPAPSNVSPAAAYDVSPAATYDMESLELPQDASSTAAAAGIAAAAATEGPGAPSRGAYAGGTIRYAPADPTLGAVEEGEDSDSQSDGPTGDRLPDIGDANYGGFEAKASMEILYQRMQQIGVPTSFPSVSPGGGGQQHLPAVFVTSDGYLANIPLQLFSSGGAQQSNALDDEED
ncbi:neuronal PAS domain-containing protein 3-like [Lethenteron reissneri]|uniref:neuronal PAS domain-containing protein 3-like n=1 Tax=Lethenteron reissneri TaxID=7753 RepID=UPI002AB7E0FC|nr:neuronal PAS domain-containing protein 3-like [Lethenteron reissneri]